mmetsp:Transcript_98199/g.278245  ORF Transcript_98199/g.278245 Transcript_98199/m.278245 type:complete len:320 (-) Transcript_98199:8-967(-)
MVLYLPSIVLRVRFLLGPTKLRLCRCLLEVVLLLGLQHGPATVSLVVLQLAAHAGDRRDVVRVALVLHLLLHRVHGLLVLLLLHEVHRGGPLLPDPLLLHEVLAVELLHAGRPASRVLIAHACRRSVSACFRVVEVKFTSSLKVKILDAVLLAMSLQVAPAAVLVGIEHLDLCGDTFFSNVISKVLHPLCFKFRLFFGDLCIERLFVHTHRPNLRIKNASSTFKLSLAAPLHLARELLLLRQPRPRLGTQDVGVQTYAGVPEAVTGIRILERAFQRLGAATGEVMEVFRHCRHGHGSSWHAPRAQDRCWCLVVGIDAAA